MAPDDGADNNEVLITALLAEHEAGHAVLMSAFGWVVSALAIAPGIGTGFTKGVAVQTDAAIPDAAQRDLWASVMISAAGIAAEIIEAKRQRLIPDGSKMLGTQSDTHKVNRGLASLGLDLGEGEQLALVWGKAELLLMRRYGFVEKIAELLRHRNTLGLIDIRPILERVPLITEDEWIVIKSTDSTLLQVP